MKEKVCFILIQLKQTRGIVNVKPYLAKRHIHTQNAILHRKVGDSVLTQ